VLASSVYHLSRDVVYASYRYYADDWRVRSHTADARYRLEMAHENYLQPHLRYYQQTAARFYAPGLVAGAPLPAYASSDYRLGPLRTATIGLTYGFHVAHVPGTISARAEYVRQWLAGGSHGGGGDERGDDNPDRAGPAGLAAAQATLRADIPPLHIGSLLLGYSVAF
jgi:hypothetical protein